MVERPELATAKERVARAAGDLSKRARSATTQVMEQAGDLREAAAEKFGPRSLQSYEEVTAEYNRAFTAMSDDGLSLLRQRERSTDLIALVELVVNSIANTPKSFSRDFEQIELDRARFLDAEEIARADLVAARKSAAGAGAGVTAGAAIASVAPTAAMWVATTFGTASTGTAISTLSGAAASQAALAWLGGGAIAAGGGGTVAGGALLALAGPVGWSLAGAAVLTSVVLFTKKKFENRETKHEMLTAVMRNIAQVQAMDAQIDDLLQRTASTRELLLKVYGEALPLFGADFATLAPAQQSQLGALVNVAKASAALLSARVEQAADDA
ncbi:hypothetical protein C5C94_03270 [Rathayibacter sp. AY1C3]|nr:hypothetical protein C5B92_16530 [Rathayibacter sp. AY1A4]PPH33535.1 hypothetical protein C5C94_03270 [Rathayibacter sp. AY1C3]PPH55379.1 hypothetical protein C5D25_16185 [Rathayibacter sp. AY1D7]PPI31965.1 hypothetical protein C5D66_06970 [Rathayibacter sp. AY1B4]